MKVTAKYHRENYRKNREKILKRKRLWVKNNKEKVAEIARRWQQKNKEKVAKFSRDYRERYKEVLKVRTQAYRSNNKEMFTGYARKRLLLQYNLTPIDYENLLKKQNYKCAICGSSNPGNTHKKHFSVDHCHKTNKVRGLLCHKCNTSLGGFNDSPKLLKLAVCYLEAE